MRTVSIDIETYSDLDLMDVGVYRYVSHPSFEVLMIAWSVNDGPEQIWDMTQWTDPESLYNILLDPKTIKCAHNANFERTALAKHFKREMPASEWRCNMVHAQTLGLPAGLGQLGEVLGLSEDDKKMKEGKALINFFCKPCKATKTNGKRTRNLPAHDPDRWELFKEYCKRDVHTEKTIRAKLMAFPVMAREQTLWETDQKINDRGVLLDRTFINKAVELDDAYKSKLMEEAYDLSKLQNPNSPAQIKIWVTEQTGIQVTSLTKTDVPEILEQAENKKVERFLEIRQELSKTSTAKYTAMQKSICDDDRVRGLLQFYGARTGRWAGRLVQVQNLPQNKLKTLDLARDLVKTGHGNGVELLYGNVPDTLSQLIRTAFIPKPGCLFYVSDYSAIEARVIAWLSGEKWRMDVFNTHGKIYEASASQMFSVPLETIVKGHENYKLRAKGKVAELALGYGGSEGALISMGALNQGLEQHELKPLVNAWRSANPAITNLWWSIDAAAIEAVKEKRTTSTHGIEFNVESGILFIKLPSGRRLGYVRPRVAPGKFGRDQLFFEGTDQVKKRWVTIDTYGPKLVENCLAGNTEVLTEKGWVRLHEITTDVKVYDGIEFVAHKGLTSKGLNLTISLDGVQMTPDHKILTEKGWVDASQSEGLKRAEIRKPESYKLRWIGWEKIKMACRVFSLRKTKNHESGSHKRKSILRMPKNKTDIRKSKNARYVKAPGILGVAIDGGPMPIRDTPSIQTIRWPWNKSIRGVAGFSKLLERHGTGIPKRANAGADGQQQRVLKRQLPMGYPQNTSEQHPEKHNRERKDNSANSRRKWRETVNRLLSVCTWRKRLRLDKTAELYQPVYDILDAGPRNRFVVKGKTGPIIVHNCIQAIARDILGEALIALTDAGYDVVMHVHDEVIVEASDKDPEKTLADIERIMGQCPEWAKGLPLGADGFYCEYYQKD